MPNFDWNVTARVVFGAGSLNKLGDLPLPGKRACVAISSGKSTRANGYLDRTLAELKRAGVEAVVFDKIGPNPLKEVVEEGARLIRDESCDFVVALGGGSVMDAGKVMAFFSAQTGHSDLWDFAGGITGKRMAQEHPSLPWIAITTTAGTGSEVDHHGVISNTATNEKIGVGAADLYAQYAIVDPELMLSVPPKFTAYQGFDALFHNVEGYLSTIHNPMGDMVERTAIENVGTYIVRAVEDGSDLEARTALAWANTLGGYSMEATSCISEHAIEHALSGYHHSLPHGAGLIMICREWASYFCERGAAPDRFINMAKWLGMADATEPMDYVRQLDKLLSACGVADLKMSDYGITLEEIGALAKNAFSAYPERFAIDPCPMSEADLCEILTKAYR